MEKERNKRILTILLLMVAVVGLSVGFAAFSTTLVIQSGATVTPDASTFAVKFSSSNTALETNAVAATVSPSTLTSKSGVIDNSGDPTISNLSVEFTAPGQSATYVFYVRNEGEYLAYLNGIKIPNKTCTPDEGTNKELVDSACNSIKVSVQVGAMSAVEETTLGITGQTLAVNESKQVTVVLSYEANGAVADGKFNVTFGDIKLTYSSIADFEIEEDKICNLTNDVDGDDVIDYGDEITCGSGGNAQTFYVLTEDTTTTDDITLITKYNLDVSDGGTGIQSATTDSVIEYGEFDADNVRYTSYYVPPYINSYKTYLTNMGVTVKEAGNYNDFYSEDFLLITNMPSNFNYTDFWLGYETGEGVWGDGVYRITTSGVIHSSGCYDPDTYPHACSSGVRPVIVIDKSIVGV